VRQEYFVGFIMGILGALSFAIVIYLALLIRKWRKIKKYAIWLLELGDLHKWNKIVKPDLNFEWKIGDNNYEIKAEDLYQIENPGFRNWIRWKFKGIQKGFLIIFRGGQDSPISYFEPRNSARKLKIVSESRALSKSLREEFKQALDPKFLMAIVIIAIVAIVGYLIMTGAIRI
jgi:hypothetical protein